jgi:hypothetical protein
LTAYQSPQLRHDSKAYQLEQADQNFDPGRGRAMVPAN